MRTSRLWVLAISALTLFPFDATSRPEGASTPPEPTPAGAAEKRAELAARFGRMPLRFEQNVGQFDVRERFVALRGGTRLSLEDDGAATLTMRAASSPPTEASLSFKVAGGRKVAPVASDELVTKSNYLLGNDPSQWRTNVANFGRVTYPGVLDGVDLVYHGEDGQIEYDFVRPQGRRGRQGRVERRRRARSLARCRRRSRPSHAGGRLRSAPPARVPARRERSRGRRRRELPHRRREDARLRGRLVRQDPRIS